MDARALELASQYCKLSNADDLFAAFDVPVDISEDDAADTVAKQRKRMQSMQSNPKYKDRAKFLLKHHRAITAVLQEAESYRESLASDREAESLPILEMAIDGMLIDGSISAREEKYVREMAANLGISAATAEHVLADKVKVAGARRTGDGDASDSDSDPSEMTVSRPIGSFMGGTNPPDVSNPNRGIQRASGPSTGWWDAGFTSLLLSHIPPGSGQMLDVYCRMAWSALSILPRRKHWSYLGIDRNEERVGLARKSIAALSARARIDVGEPSPLRLRDESVDAVLAIRALQTTEDTRPILEEAHRVLRPGGRLLVVEPDGLAEAFYFNGHLAEYNQAFHHLCATLDRQLDAAYSDLPATARPGLALGPQLAIRAEAAGFSVKKVAVHAATNLQPVALEGLVRRLRGYPRAIARANGMEIDAPEVVACRTAAATLLKSLPRDSEARGGNTLPLFLCVAVKT